MLRVGVEMKVVNFPKEQHPAADTSSLNAQSASAPDP
jgi:hypothetical protein